MAKFKVVVLDKLLPLTDIERNILSNIDADVQQFNVKTPAEIIEIAGDADAVMTVGVKLTAEAIEGLKNVKVIGRYGIGLDNVDLKAATEKNIVVTYCPVYCQDEVATLTVCLMLACERRLIQADRVVKGGHWENSLQATTGARSIKGKVFGFVGFGSIAQKVVPMVQPFGVKVIAYDPYINLDACKKLDVESVELKEVLQKSDYISLHVPLLPSTKHMIDEEQFSMMKRDAILINTGRGGLINQKALVRAIQERKIASAGLDVLEEEPPNPQDPIFTLENVITSGHIAAATIESTERLRTQVAQGVADVLSGHWPSCIGNPDIKEKISLK